MKEEGKGELEGGTLDKGARRRGFRGGLGVGERPTCGELVRSTHRVASHFISSYDFSSKPFGEPRHFMGLAAAYGPCIPAVYHPFVFREAG